MSVPKSDKAGIRQVIRALKAGGYNLDSVWDGEESTPVSTEKEAVDIIMGLDQAHLYVEKDGDSTSWVFFVLGNDPDEVVNDYTTDLEVVDKLTSSWFE